MPKIANKPKVCIQTMISERNRDYLILEARRLGLSLSELIRRVLDEVIETDKERKRRINVG